MTDDGRRASAPATVVALVVLLSLTVGVAVAGPIVGAGTTFEASDSGPTITITEQLELDDSQRFPDGNTVDLSPHAIFNSSGSTTATVDQITGTWTNVSTTDVSNGLEINASDKQPVTLQGSSVSAINISAVDSSTEGVDIAYDAGADVTVTVAGLPADTTIDATDVDTDTLLDQQTTDSTGTATFTLDSGAHDVTFTEASAQFQVDITGTDSPVSEGETLTVDVTVENTGTTSGTSTVELRNITGVAVDDQSVSLDAGATSTLSLEWTTAAGDAGSGAVTVDSGDDTATQSVTVNSVDTNGPPTATADSYEVSESETLTVSASGGILANDNDPDGDSMSVALDTDVTDGNLTLDEDGSFEYTPDDGFSGEDSFTYQVSDGNGGTDTATVTVTVTERSPTFTVAITDADSSVTEGETLSVTAAVANSGEVAGTQNITLADFDGTVADNRSISLDSGNETDVTLEWHTGDGDAGIGAVTVRTANESATSTVVVETPGGGGSGGGAGGGGGGGGSDDSDSDGGDTDDSDGGDAGLDITVDDAEKDDDSNAEDDEIGGTDDSDGSEDTGDDSDAPDTLQVTIRNTTAESTATLDETTTGRTVGSTENTSIERISMEMARGRDRATLAITTYGPAVFDRPGTAPEAVADAAHDFEVTTNSVAAGYVNVDHDFESSDLGGVTIQFTTRKALLDDLGADAADVQLYRKASGEDWRAVETEQVGENETHVRFESTAPGFSVFAIGTGADALALTATELHTDTVTVGDDARVTAQVRNRGATERERTLQLTADGDPVATETRRVDGGQTLSVDLAFTPEDTGSYDLAVDGEQVGTLRVQRDTDGAAVTVDESGQTEDDGGFPWAIAALGLAVVVLVVAGYRRHTGGDSGAR